ncbi:reverse transcriptase family protein [Gluconobacter kondonii]|uniref:reverse transcriptase family protein n=1 Tax=Gluconobacter kondonii TaxID=941463 RepID=UPI00209F35F1|nr:reverse transcriptase family protein [Gluconobacter kondonii]MCP1237677.1 reverse transcriptase family protein [Gluconobacter kondonii]
MSKGKQAKQPRIPIDRCHLYGIQSPHTLAKRLGWELNKLNGLAANGGYRVYKHKDTGREIQEPGASLQSLHRQLHRYLARVEVPDYLHSAVKGRSYLSNARAHVGDGRLLKIDIAKFYQSVPQHKVMHFFRDVMGCASDVAGLLANLICYRSVLATGSSISPIISYYTYKSLFDKLAAVAAGHGLIMTCYVDDITMSGSRASRAVLHEARSVIFRAGLRAHKDRSFTDNSVKIVTGVVVGRSGIALPFSRWQKIRQAMREIAACTDDTKKLKLYPRLISRLYEAAQIDPQCRSRAEFYHSQWRVLKRQSSMAKIEAIAATQAA